MSAAKWSVRNRVAVNLLTLALLISGIVTAQYKLKLDLFPDVSTNFIVITTLDVTTSIPEDIERTITIPIEEELSDVDGIVDLSSISQDNFSSIYVEVDPDITDINPILGDIRQAVDKAKNELPTSAEDPLIESFDIPFPLASYTISYPRGFDLKEVRPTLDALERKLKLVPGVSDVLIDGLEDREVWVEVDPYKLQSVGVSFAEIVDTVARKNLNAVGGRLDSAGGQRVVRILGEIEEASELESLPIKEVNGRLVRISDVGVVKETTEKAERLGRVNLKPAVTYSVIKKRGADVIKAAKIAKEVFKEEVKNLPPELETRIVADSTKYINTRVETVLKNGFQALLLVTLLLMLLLDWRLALIVAFGLPVSFAGTFVVMHFTGNSINLLSLFAMIMALGMVVDDAVVISENVFRYYEMGMSRTQAAIRGTEEVMWPVLGSVSTTVAAFLPLINGEGIIGKFLAVVPVVVISALVFSLIQAFLVLPSHLADFLKPRRPKPKELGGGFEHHEHSRKSLFGQVALTYTAIREAVDRVIGGVIEIYLHLLTIALRWRYFVIVIFVVMMMAMVVALRLGVVRFQLFATDYADTILVKLELPADYTLQQTEDELAKVERRIVETLPKDDLAGLITRIGAQLDAANEFQDYGSNLAMITVDVDEQNPAARKPSIIEADLRNVLNEFPKFTRATAKKEEGGPPVGRAINVEILGLEYDELREISAKVQRLLADIDGVVNISDDFPRGKTEYQVQVDEEKAARLGVDVQTISQTLLAGFRGIEAAKMRWGNDEVTIRVKMDERFSQNPEILRGFPVKSRTTGELIDLSSVATLERTSGIARIKRANQQRQLTVSADVDVRVMNSSEANKIIKENLGTILEDHPGYTVQLTGENEDSARSIAAMVTAAGIAFLLIYVLLATITNSFMLPVVIMLVIPFAIIGVLVGLIIQGEPLGLMSIMGTIALAGIVVNNSVVFVDFINRHRHETTKWERDEDRDNIRVQPKNMSSVVRWRSIMLCARTRFRPIFLTTCTTVVGLMGLAFFSTGQEEFLAPMAQAVVWGLTFASLITMILIPCSYAILDDLKGNARKAKA